MKKIIYTRPDGGLSVVTPIINTHSVVNGELAPLAEDVTEEFAIARAMARLPANAADVQIVDESAIPADRTFRDAWKAVAGKVEHDMDKAREIHKMRMRVRRSPMLSALDVEYMRADEAGDVEAKQRITAQKKALRDITSDPRITSAQTPEELKAVTL
jgi:hypothetical protein